ncbi:MAG: hypothetical protein AB3N16_08515 [Flavobacteriaceae bacterium]
MRAVVLGILVVALFSCNRSSRQEKKVQARFHQEIMEIDWNDVDTYPMFASCDETQPKKVQRQCFEIELLHHFSKALGQYEFVVGERFNTTAYVDFMIDSQGTIKVLQIQKNRIVERYLPEFDGLITHSLKNLPSLSPALKRGMPVNARFRVPIILNTKDD